MIELSQLTVLIMSELMVGLAILSGILAFFAMTRKGRIRKAAHHLAERVQNDKPARTERLKELLTEKFGYSGDELEQTVRSITQAEMQLFQNLINGYMQDNQALLHQVNVDEENLVLAYQELKVPEKVGDVSEATGNGEEKDEMQRLQEENKRLSDELRVTMDTMGRMLNEYSSMFAGGEDKPLTQASAKPADAEPEQEPAEGQQEEPETLAEDVSADAQISERAGSETDIEPLPVDPDTLLDSESEAVSSLEEEVSEIIDEVMEMADEMNQGEEIESEPEGEADDVGESLLDELEQVNIDLPESSQVAESGGVETESEASSLEDEWAKLLEEEAESKQKSDD
jgi:hypothetical protein